MPAQCPVDHQFHWTNDERIGRLDRPIPLQGPRETRRERQRRESFELRVVSWDQLEEADWMAFERFYRTTVDKKWSHHYLTEEWFQQAWTELAHLALGILAVDAQGRGGRHPASNAESTCTDAWAGPQSYRDLLPPPIACTSEGGPDSRPAPGHASSAAVFFPPPPTRSTGSDTVVRRARMTSREREALSTPSDGRPCPRGPFRRACEEG